MRTPGAPHVVTCMLLLAAVEVLLRTLGFRRTMRWARRCAPLADTTMDRAAINGTLARLVTATALYPGRSRCLEQSVAGFMLLRRRGFDVQLRFGVQPYPFCAHAWLELDAVPISDSTERLAGYVMLPEPAL